MEKSQLLVRYLQHSGFSVEDSSHFFVFDYYRGEIILPLDKAVYVFVSHRHPDHYNPQILEWQKSRPDIRYLISSDVELPASTAPVYRLDPDQCLGLDEITVKTYGSTDQGVSFLVKSEGWQIFHAGDLNWWAWWDDTPEEKAQMENAFKAEIAKLKGERIDLAFFPVDPRLRKNISLGAAYFIDQVAPQYFVPMHFSKLPAVQRFAENMADSPSKILVFSQPGETRDIFSPSLQL